MTESIKARIHYLKFPEVREFIESIGWILTVDEPQKSLDYEDVNIVPGIKPISTRESVKNLLERYEVEVI